MSAGWHIAQVNIARLVAPQGDPRVQSFFDALDRVNALADASTGFVWRLQDDSGNSMGIRYSTDPLLAINITVWRDPEALFDFVYRSAHTPVMAQRGSYTQKLSGAYQAMWWIPAGSIPTINDALAKLWLLDREGPTPLAFTFKARFPAPDEIGSPVDHRPDPWCDGTA